DLAKDPNFKKQLIELRKALTTRVKALPDLSFLPESKLVSEVLGDPVAYGQSHKTNISHYVDIADLALQSPDVAVPKLQTAATAEDPVSRYWAYSVCSILGEDAAPMMKSAKLAADSDPDLLVRLRAAEFLGVLKERDPVPVIRNILANSESTVVNLITLQSLVYFQDGPFDYETTLKTDSVKSIDDQVMRRLGYLDGLPEAEIRNRMKAIMRSKKTKQGAQFKKRNNANK
ncbi:MAG: hypothetical protein ACI814_003534, partial [Mariniblastus sp.]